MVGSATLERVAFLGNLGEFTDDERVEDAKDEDGTDTQQDLADHQVDLEQDGLRYQKVLVGAPLARDDRGGHGCCRVVEAITQAVILVVTVNLVVQMEDSAQ